MNQQPRPDNESACEILNRFHPGVTFPEIKAGMMGTILAVEMVSPLTALEKLFGNSAQAKLDFQNSNDARSYMATIMDLWNELTIHQEPSRPFHFSQIPQLEVDDKACWISFAEQRESEISAFLKGLALGNTPTASDFINPTEDQLGTYLPVNLQAGRKSLAKLRAEIESDSVSHPAMMVGAMVKTLDDRYFSLYPAFAKELQAWRLEALKDLRQTDTIRRTEPKVGRNDPCPCGSGRKFKQCCLR